MKIFLATDHGGFEMKELLKNYLAEKGYDFEDCGAFEFDETDDYVGFIADATRKVLDDLDNHRAIIFGGSGQGEAMLANRFVGIRATVYYGGDPQIVATSREHNDANVLSIGGRFITKEELLKAVDLWLHTDFTGKDRYIRRIKESDREALKG